MKFFITIIFSFAISFAKAGSTLNLNIFCCKTDSLENFYSIKIYKDGLFFKNIQLGVDNKFDTTLSDLQKGIYNFEFTNIFNQLVLDTLNISKDTTYWRSFCTDNFLNINQSFKGHLDSLKTNDSFYIEFESYGCFHWDLQKLKVFKKSNAYFSTLYPTRKIRERKTERKKIQTIKLDKKQVDAIIAFQIDTYKNAVGYPGSTEITYYTFKYKSSKIKFIDSKAARDRFYILVKYIFGS